MHCSRLYQSGTIAHMDGRRARIAFAAFAGCSACQGRCGFARVATLLRGTGRTELQVDIDPAQAFASGERVAVGIDAGRLLLLVLLTYALPLAGILIGAVVLSSLAANAGDPIAVSGALLGGAVGALPALAMRRLRLTTAWLDARVARVT